MLAEDMARLYADPLGFVRYIFDWGEGDLTGWEGPDAWQAEYLAVLGEAIRTRAAGDVIKMAVKSGRGPGKSAVIAWLILFFMSTRPNFSGVVTANTGDQLDGKTWRELALWHGRALNKHWFEWTAGKFVHVEQPDTWKVVAQKWSEHRPDAFGGLHNGGRGQCTIIDEGSGVPESIFAVAEATNTDPDSFVFAFGNPIHKASYFYQIFTRFRHRWLTMTVDARRAKAANQKQIQDMIDDWGLTVTAKVQDETRSRLIAFDDAMRLRPSAAAADPDRAGGAGLPSLSGGAGSADDAGADTLIPREDARICGENTIELIGWQAWYAAQHQLGAHQ